MRKLLALPALVTLFATQSAFAHPGHDVASSAMAGLMHPLTGVDHLIALVSVGALLALATVRVRVAGMIALLIALAAGAGVGLAGWKLPAAEWMIALSVLVAGVMLVRSGATRPVGLLGGVLLFALFHGYAHGVETAGDASAFVAGFLTTSVVIALMSMAAARLYVERSALRIAAGGVAGVAGVALLSLLAI
jgi:urease accessory protein